jgi:TraY domain
MAAQKAKARRGRPGRTPRPGERVALSLRVTPDAKAKLDRAATENGRSQSQEAELRLERSFQDEDLLPQVLSLAFGERLAAILLAIGFAMKDAATASSFAVTFSQNGSWTDEPYAYDEAVKSALQILESLRPEGQVVTPPAVASLERENPNLSGKLGIGFANAILEQAASGLARIDRDREQAKTLRRLFGDELAHRIARFDLLTEKAR